MTVVFITLMISILMSLLIRNDNEQGLILVALFYNGLSFLMSNHMEDSVVTIIKFTLNVKPLISMQKSIKMEFFCVCVCV